MNNYRGDSYGYNPSHMYATQSDMDDTYMMQMYPEACLVIHRHAEQECIRREAMGHLPYTAYPSRAVLDEMIEEVYKKCKTELYKEKKEYKEHEDRQPFYFGGDGIFRDLVAIILLGELFRRRRLFRRRFFLGI
ncbi:MAG: hypothetical protein HPY66_1805 [Firmicutes bacterium]|nr:hypothetical protein [Bacillota bacterium]MDI6706234.1 hypothetical protein [Bacillota bacterium]